jgi:hypothetical protein
MYLSICTWSDLRRQHKYNTGGHVLICFVSKVARINLTAVVCLLYGAPKQPRSECSTAQAYSIMME